MNSCLIITAGGTGSRFKSDLPKQFHEIEGIPIIIRTINAFSDIAEIKSIVITVPENYHDLTEDLLKDYKITTKYNVIPGGKERQDSVYNALRTKEAKSSDIVIIHDAVRPFVSTGLIRKLMDAAVEIGGAVPVLRPKDTIRELRIDGSINTLSRENLYAAQTPQVFKTSLILEAFSNAYKDSFRSTDDAALFEYSGFDMILMDGEEDNIKITTLRDMKISEVIISELK